MQFYIGIGTLLVSNLIIICRSIEFNHVLDDYLTTLSRDFDSEEYGGTNERDDNKIIFNYGNTDKFRMDSDFAHIFTIKNQTYLISDTQSIPSSATLIPMSNFKLFKAFTYGDINIVSVIQENGSLDLFYLVNGSLEKFQTISGFNVSDVEFLMSENQLLLVLGTHVNTDDHGDLKIYKWIGTYFDVQTYLITKNILHVATIPKGIIITQDNEYVTVYEYYYQKLRKIQKIPIINPYDIATHIHKNSNYLTVSETSGKNNVYQWNGHHFILEFVFHTSEKILALTFLELETPLLTVLGAKKLSVFNLEEKQVLGTLTLNLKNVKQISFTNCSTGLMITKHDKTAEITEFTIIAKIQQQNPNNLQNCLVDLKNEVDKAISKTHPKIMSAFQNNSRTNAAFGPSAQLILLQPEDAIAELVGLLDDVQTKYQNLKDEVDNFQIEDTLILLNAEYLKSINADNIEMNDVAIKMLNNKTWEPDNWLMYNEKQIITGQFTAYDVTVQNFKPISSPNLFSDLLTKDSHPFFLGPISAQEINLRNMKAHKINNIPVDDMFVKGKSVGGVKTFNNMFVKEAKLTNINQELADSTLSLFADNSLTNFAPVVEIDNLWVEEINGINWNSFRDSVFRLEKSTNIKGNLKFNKLMTDRLKVQTVNGQNVNDFMTSSTHQTINSTIRFTNIFANNMKVETINHIPFDNYAKKTSNDTQYIEGLVRLNKLDVKKKLQLIGDFASLYMKQGSEIIGTDQSHFLQMYDNEVIVKGNVYIHNLTLLENIKLFLSEEHFDLDFEQYWSKSANQKIDVHVTAEKGLSTTNLFTNFINGIKTQDFIINSPVSDAEANFHFENITILGNLILDNRETHTPDFKLMDTQGVKVNGSYYIKGKKTYTNTLKVENLSANKNLGDINSLDALPDLATEVFGKKVFKKIIVKENLHCGRQNVDIINDVPIKSYFKDVIFINSDVDGGNVSFDKVTVKNLYAEKINDNNMDEYISKVNTINNQVIQNLYVNGEANFEKITDVVNINNITANALLKNVITSKRITKPVKFSSKIKVKNVIVKTINDVDLEQLTNILLYKNADQKILAPYTFNKIKTNKLYTSQINNFTFNDAIDENGNLLIQTDVKFMKVKVKELQGASTSPCDIKDLLENISIPSQKFWKNVKIFGNTTFLDSTSDVYGVLFDTVKKNKDNIVSAEVLFKNHVSIEDMFVKEERVNGTNLREILEDVVVKNKQEEQIIEAVKTFPQLHMVSALISNNADIPAVNDILIQELDSRILSQADDMIVTGKKTFFGGLQAKNISTNFISNITPDQMVTFNSRVASSTFEQIEVKNNLDVTNINNVNIFYVLENRLFSNSSKVQFTNATYFFDSLEFTDGLHTAAINNIDINNIVTDTNIQSIHSKKVFNNDVSVIGNVQVGYMNNVPVSETYEQLLLLSEVGNIKGSVTMMVPTKITGHIEAKNLNGMPWKDIMEIMHSSTTQTRINSLYVDKNTIMNHIDNIYYLTQNLPSDYMYIEKFHMLDMDVPNTVNSKTVETSGHVLIHITSEEPGDKCGLPVHCKCPWQQTVEMTPQHSIHNFLNKGIQRVYTYSDDQMIANVISNSISTDSECRKDNLTAAAEVTSLTWSTVSNSERNGTFYVFDEFIQGYMSGVEFFVVDNTTYAFIGIYYDPMGDTHDVESRIIKFSDDRSSASIIQYIPSKGVKTVYLFHSAQGIILILGSEYTTDLKTEQTDIYRFNIENEKFEILRSIPAYGCSAAAGVVLSRDNLIILAHKLGPILVLKYEPSYDNYYYYQSFQMDSPVKGISVFYTGGVGISDAYLCIVSEDEHYYIYSFQFISGWKLENSGEMDGLQKLIPFDMNHESYLLAPTKLSSPLFTIIKHGLK